MVPFRSAFVQYRAMPGGYIVLADKSRIPSLGIGTVRFCLGSYILELCNVLHVPSLRAVLFSVRCHRRSPGCSFIADNKGAYLVFPSFFISVDDSSDCLISSSLIDHPTLIHHLDYSATINMETASAVCDNTCSKRCKMQKQSTLMVSPTPSIGTTDSSDLSSTLLTMITQSAPFPDLPKASTPLSDMQLQHVADMCINSLRTDGIVTQKVITKLIQQGFLLPSLTTPTLTPSTTTPQDRPELLPSDKVPSSTPGHRRLSIHQLHHYIGFRTLKNWHSLIDVGQPTIDIINDGVPPLEFGDVANMHTSR